MTKKVAKDESGMAYAEYLILVVVFGLPVSAMFVSLGLTLVEAFHHAQTVLTAPVG